MNRRTTWVSIGVGVVVVALAAWWVTRSLASRQASSASTTTAPATQASGEDQDSGVATVQTATARIGDISQPVTLYGTVSFEPGAVQLRSVSVDVRVVRLHVVNGQPVPKGAPLIDVEASPDAQLQLLDARNGLAAAQKDLQDTRQRFNLKLATTSELQQAQQAEQTAQVKLDNLQRRGVGEGVTTLKADADSLVTKIDVQPGQFVQADNSLLECVPEGAIAARLGAEPPVAAQLRVGESVQLTRVGGGQQELPGQIRLIGQQMNAETRLVDVYVSVPAADHLLLDSYVRGELTTSRRQALLVPREAVLPADQGFILFTVKEGHAVKHTVIVPIQNDQDAAIAADDVHAGDMVVTQGNLELDDGTAVTIEAAASGSADTGDAK